MSAAYNRHRMRIQAHRLAYRAELAGGWLGMLHHHADAILLDAERVRRRLVRFRVPALARVYVPTGE